MGYTGSFGGRREISTVVTQEVKDKFIALAKEKGYTAYGDFLRKLVLDAIAENDKNV